MSWLAATIAGLASALAPGGQAAVAPGGGWHEAVALSTDAVVDASGALAPAVAAGPGGRTAVAFMDTTPGGPRVAVSIRAAGGAFSGAVELPRAPALAAGLPSASPAVALGPRGAVAVAWLGRGRRGRTVVLVALRPAGAPRFRAPVALSAAGPAPLPRPPAVALDARGRVLVAWAVGSRASVDTLGGARPTEVLAARSRRPSSRGFTAARVVGRGRSVSPPVAAPGAIAWAGGGALDVLRADGGSRAVAAPGAEAPALAATPDGRRRAVAWATRSALSAAVLGTSTRVRQDVRSGLVAGPFVGVDAAGRLSVAWQDERGVLVAGPQAAPERVTDATDTDVLLTGFGVSPTGAAVVAYASWLSGSPEVGTLVRASVRVAGATAFAAPTTISTYGRSTSTASVAAGSDGAAAVAWVSRAARAPRALLLVAVRPAHAAPPGPPGPPDQLPGVDAPAA